jgi:hypothetical protein
MRRIAAFALAVTGLATAAAPAAAQDAVIATVERPTTVDAYAGRAVWSAWDPAIRAYRLTEHVDGHVRTVPVAPNRVPFDVDLGPDARGRTLAVYSRCRRPPIATWVLNGRRGCDLHLYDFARARERRLTRANSDADEYWPTVWRSRIAFTRIYPRRYPVLYWRPLDGGGASRRLRGGPTNVDDVVAEELDMSGSRVAYTWTYEYGGDLRLDTVGGEGRRLVELFGSGAAANVLEAQGPALVGRDVYWAFSVSQDAPVYSEIRRHDIATRRNFRATTRIDADPSLPSATAGFGQDRGVSWYVRAAAPNAYEVHRASGMTYERAPPIRLD